MLFLVSFHWWFEAARFSLQAKINHFHDSKVADPAVFLIRILKNIGSRSGLNGQIPFNHKKSEISQILIGVDSSADKIFFNTNYYIYDQFWDLRDTKS